METQSLSTEIRRSKAAAARQMSVAQRLSAGLRLYTEQLCVVRGFVAGMNPDWTELQVDQELDRRRLIIDLQNTKKYYRPAPEIPARQANQS